MPRPLVCRLLCAGVFLGAGPAFAQEILLTGPIAQAESASNPASRHAESFVLPSGTLELGGELTFLTSKATFGRDALEFTDLALFEPRVRWAFATAFEVYAVPALLPKQPSHFDEPLFQGMSGGFRAAIVDNFAATVGAAAGPLLGEAGHYFQSGPNLAYRPALDRDLRFELSAGDSLTAITFSSGAGGTLYLHELQSGFSVLVGDRSGGGWLGFDYSVPLSDNRDRAPFGEVMTRVLPQNRLGFKIGAVATLRKEGWDLWAEYRVVDRGDREDPATMLPILNGGFDQQQISFGVQHRFDFCKKKPREPGYY